jgi:phosphomevalonate kinase
MILLVSGWSNSGKSTVAELLKERYGARVFAFADQLKRIVADEFQFPFEWTQTQEGKQRLLSNGKSVRDLLIQRGQEIRAEKNDAGFFARLIAKQISALPMNETMLCVISDWRLVIELETLKQEFPDVKLFTIRIQREGQEKSPVHDSLTEHELDVFPFDYILQNSGHTKDTLALTLTTMMFHLQSSR